MIQFLALLLKFRGLSCITCVFRRFLSFIVVGLGLGEGEILGVIDLVSLVDRQRILDFAPHFFEVFCDIVVVDDFFIRVEAGDHEMLADIDKETVDFGPNYDGSEQEPLVLPSKCWAARSLVKVLK